MEVHDAPLLLHGVSAGSGAATGGGVEDAEETVRGVTTIGYCHLPAATTGHRQRATVLLVSELKEAEGIGANPRNRVSGAEDGSRLSVISGQ